MNELITDLRRIASWCCRSHFERGAAKQAADEIEALRSKIDKLKAARLKLDKRIHNQRVALRENWEIVEMRRKWMGHPIAFQRYNSLLKRYQEALATIRAHAGQSGDASE